MIFYSANFTVFESKYKFSWYWQSSVIITFIFYVLEIVEIFFFKFLIYSGFSS